MFGWRIVYAKTKAKCSISHADLLSTQASKGSVSHVLTLSTEISRPILLMRGVLSTDCRRISLMATYWKKKTRGDVSCLWAQWQRLRGSSSGSCCQCYWPSGRPKLGLPCNPTQRKGGDEKGASEGSEPQHNRDAVREQTNHWKKRRNEMCTNVARQG